MVEQEGNGNKARERLMLEPRNSWHKAALARACLPITGGALRLRDGNTSARHARTAAWAARFRRGPVVGENGCKRLKGCCAHDSGGFERCGSGAESQCRALVFQRARNRPWSIRGYGLGESPRIRRPGAGNIRGEGRGDAGEAGLARRHSDTGIPHIDFALASWTGMLVIRRPEPVRACLESGRGPRRLLGRQ